MFWADARVVARAVGRVFWAVGWAVARVFWAVARAVAWEN